MQFDPHTLALHVDEFARRYIEPAARVLAWQMAQARARMVRPTPAAMRARPARRSVDHACATSALVVHERRNVSHKI